MGDGVVLDFRHKADGERITVDDVKKALARVCYEIKALDIVVIQTGADAAWGTPEYLVKGPGMERESTLWLLEKGVKIVGTDWDRPLPYIAEEFKRTGDARVIWDPFLPESTSATATWRRWPTSRPLAAPTGSQSAASPSR